MPERKVRFALITYVVDGHTEIATRGSVVDLSDAEAKRYDALNAVVPVDAELDRPGTLGTLPESPTDEELIAWVLAATDAEVSALVVARPELAARISGAKLNVDDLRESEAERLANAIKISDRADVPEAEPAPMIDEGEASVQFTTPGSADDPGADPGTSTPPAAGEPASGAAVSTDGASGDDGGGEVTVESVQAQIGADATRDVLTAEEADSIVSGNRDSVIDYLAENPETAADVLAAEVRRAEAAGQDPRVTVLRAVEAAAASEG